MVKMYGFLLGVALALSQVANTASADFVLVFAPSSSSGQPGTTVTKDLFLYETATAASSVLLQGLHSFNVTVDFSVSSGSSPAVVASELDFKSNFSAPAESKGLTITAAAMDANAFLGSRLFGTLVSPGVYGVKIAEYTFTLGTTPGEVTTVTASATGALGDWSYGDFGFGGSIAQANIASAAGSISAVPEPSSVAVIGLVAGLVGLRRRSRC